MSIKEIRNKFEPFKEENIDHKEKDQSDHHYRYRKTNSSSSLGKFTIYENNHKEHSKNVILKMDEIINDYPKKFYKSHLKRYWAKFFMNVFASLLHPVIILLYLSSLTACSKNFTLDECIEKIEINYYYRVYLLCFISGSLISLILVFIAVKFASIYHLPFIILELSAFILINHEDNIYKNGLFSFHLLCYSILISFLLLLFFILFLIKLGKKHYFYSVFFFFAFHFL